MWIKRKKEHGQRQNMWRRRELNKNNAKKKKDEEVTIKGEEKIIYFIKEKWIARALAMQKISWCFSLSEWLSKLRRKLTQVFSVMSFVMTFENRKREYDWMRFNEYHFCRWWKVDQPRIEICEKEGDDTKINWEYKWSIFWNHFFVSSSFGGYLLHLILYRMAARFKPNSM